MKKLKLWLAVFTLSTGLLFTGCSKENAEQAVKQESEQKEEQKEDKKEDKKEVTPMTVDFKTKIYENDKFSIEIPEDWVADDKSNPTALVQIYNEEMITQDFSPNIVITNGDVIVDDMKEVKKQMEKEINAKIGYGMNIIKSEVIDRPFGQIYMIHVKTHLTEEILDKWVKEELITKDQINLAGGKENVIKKMDTEQVQIYVKKDGLGVIIGTTFNDSCYEEMKEVALYIAETFKVK